MTEPKSHQLPAARLKEHFTVKGHFYCLNRGSARYLCRDLLEIHRSSKPGVQADAIVIMMNPGGSMPLEGDGLLPRNAASLEPARPDLTQYQVMRLMQHFRWSFVRVINLSDLREPRSAQLLACIKACEKAFGRQEHSIFANHRSAELQAALVRKPQAPIIAAWGLNRGLRTMAQAAVTSLNGAALIGLRDSSREFAYRHPQQRTQKARETWCEAIIEKV